jgi:hypothetical protein
MYLSQINTYPIKSTHPITANNSYLLPTGLPFDRHWMLVDEDNTMLTARKHPKLLHITTQIAGSNLLVQLPQQDFLIPLKPLPQNEILVHHWGDTPLAAWPQNQALDDALSQYLGLSCSLVYSASLGTSSDGESALPQAASFADAQPVLLTTTASLAALNERLDEAVDGTIAMQRFRSNLVVSNLTADVEDGWQRIRIGACELLVSYPCTRCILTIIDPVTLQAHAHREPLRTLAKYRRLEEGGVGFGINLQVVKGGPIAINDRVEILA